MFGGSVYLFRKHFDIFLTDQDDVQCHVEPLGALAFEPSCEKTDLRGFRLGPTQTRLYCHRRWLEA